MVIQQLLAEAGHDGGTDLVSVDAHGLKALADWVSLRSPENYTGYERTANFGSPGGPCGTSRTPMPSRRGWGSTSGRCRGLDHGGRGDHA
jgi:hypothetical protein